MEVGRQLVFRVVLLMNDGQRAAMAREEGDGRSESEREEGEAMRGRPGEAFSLSEFACPVKSISPAKFNTNWATHYNSLTASEARSILY